MRSFALTKFKKSIMFNKELSTYFKFLPTQLIIGIALCTCLPLLFLGGLLHGQNFLEVDVFNFIMSSAIVIFTIMTLHSMHRFPGIVASSYILPVVFFWFIIIIVFTQIFNLIYSLVYYGLSTVSLLIYLFLVDITNRRKTKYKFAYIPVGRAKNLPEQIPMVDCLRLEIPRLDSTVSAIVTDLHSYDLTKEWEKFIADKTLQGIPVYHHRNIRESLTGRVRINHMYENDLGSLLPSENYMAIKRFLEVLLILISLPITIPIMLVTALVIKLESSGSILFVQQRVGLGGKEFKIYKFRSMSKNSEANGAQMASEGDMRVTRIGRFIRKVRIDELPQFWNIVKGDMSLIGPRPEQKIFVDEFDKSIPFYNYRHIVKPGITGWAQVMHGYAADEDETKIKVEHDFYYIKNFSLSLDMLIFFKTIFTMLTGFGAR